MYGRGLIYPCMCDEAGRAGVRLELPSCHDHVVVGLPRYALMVRAPAPRRRIEVAAYA